MIETYADLHKLVEENMDSFMANNPDELLEFGIAENASCSITYPKNGNKMLFMLAKFGHEYKVGFAFFEEGEKAPDWMDDIFNHEFNGKFINTLIEEHLLKDSPF